MLMAIKCESCGKELLIGDVFNIAGQLIIKVAPCGCRSTETDCSDCEDMELLKKVQEELKTSKVTVQELRIQLAEHEAIP